MTNILTFVLKANQKTLSVIFKNAPHQESDKISLSYEYLRVFSPAELHKASSAKNATHTPQVFHKKNIRITHIESIGKHGHRIVFDDGFSDIYSDNELSTLAQNFELNWSQYIASLSSTNNREESINFKSVT